MSNNKPLDTSAVIAIVLGAFYALFLCIFIAVTVHSDNSYERWTVFGLSLLFSVTAAFFAGIIQYSVTKIEDAKPTKEELAPLLTRTLCVFFGIGLALFFAALSDTMFKYMLAWELHLILALIAVAIVVGLVVQFINGTLSNLRPKNLSRWVMVLLFFLLIGALVHYKPFEPKVVTERTKYVTITEETGKPRAAEKTKVTEVIKKAPSSYTYTPPQTVIITEITGINRPTTTASSSRGHLVQKQ